MPAYQVTGNEYVSLPAIREDTGAVQGLTVLHMGAKGLLELCGGDAPLIAPVVRVAGQEAMLAKLRWRRENAWVPVAQGEAQGLTVTLTYLCPLGERAFFMRLEAKNRRDAPLEVQATSYLALSARMVSLSIRVCSMQNTPPKWEKGSKNKAMRKIADGFYGFTVSVLALSVSLCSTALPKEEPLAVRESFRFCQGLPP